MAGETVPPVNGAIKSPSFVEPGAGAAAGGLPVAPTQPTGPEGPEPNPEAIEMHLNGTSSDYVKMY